MNKKEFDSLYRTLDHLCQSTGYPTPDKSLIKYRKKKVQIALHKMIETLRSHLPENKTAPQRSQTREKPKTVKRPTSYSDFIFSYSPSRWCEVRQFEFN